MPIINFTKLNIILLAAGLSRRMGDANKLLLPFKNSTILQTTLENILTADIGNIIVVVGYEADKVKKILENYPSISIVENIFYEQGMTSSIQTGVKYLKPENNGLMICLGDMLFIESEEYRQIANFFLDASKEDDKIIVQPEFKQMIGNPIVFSDCYLNEISSHGAPEGCREIIQKHKVHLKKVTMSSNNILKDIDKKEDYLKEVNSMK